jgi:4'-phosphopantetheinyl transferase EntD
MLFSAKESVYKAWFPLIGTWLGFEDAVATFDWDNGTLYTCHKPRPRNSGDLLDLLPRPFAEPLSYGTISVYP